MAKKIITFKNLDGDTTIIKGEIRLEVFSERGKIISVKIIRLEPTFVQNDHLVLDKKQLKELIEILRYLGFA